VQPDGETIDIVHHVGYSAEVQTHWRAFDITDDVPASEAIRTGTPIFLRTASERDLRYPVFQFTPVVGDEAVAVLPLRVAGRTLGALVVGFERARDFTTDDERFLDSLASQAAQALDRANLHDAAAAAAHRLAFLADAAAVLNASLDLSTTLRNLAALAVPRLGDWCSVHLTGPDGTPQFVVATHRDPEKQVAAQELLTRWPVGRASAVGKALADGTTTIFPVVVDEVLAERAEDDEHLRLLRILGGGAGQVVPITAWGRVAGALSLANEPGRPVTDDEHALARDLAARAGAAIANAQLYADRVHVARELQATLLPSSLPVADGVEFGARYAAAGGGAEVGGDFYDVLPIEGGWLLAVGDVRGKGVEAAAVTGVARHTIRALAPEHREPAEVLRRLNRVLVAREVTDPEPRFCTVALVKVTTSSTGATADICIAGHPPPLVLRTDGSVEVCAGAGSLLGVLDDPQLGETRVELRPGDALLLYTDGIIERHEGQRFFEEAGLAAALAAVPPGATARTIVEAVHDAALDFVEGELGDDMAVLAVRVAP
ncbi:MAG: SpoIIE family protein phosphatase, partial [Actinomycetota bacterium]